jgi:hypothetical protein
LYQKKAVKITVNEVLSEIVRPNSIFNIGFRKNDGSYSDKKGITLLNGDRKKKNRNGLINCYDAKNDYTFSATIDFLIEFNGMEIIRPE